MSVVPRERLPVRWFTGLSPKVNPSGPSGYRIATCVDVRRVVDALEARYATDVIVCAPVTPDGKIDPRWGKADWLAVANVADGAVTSWELVEVSWSRLHDEGSSARHHARVARFLLDHQIEAVIADHVGDGMVRMLSTMKIQLLTGAQGDARSAVLTALAA